MPTPVSALLHAATMVCSGVFVLVRSSFILEYTPSILLTILWLSGFTTLISGLIAVVTNDIKRVIALSTMSQLARKYILYIFRHQTICVEIILKNIINSQITKAHDIYYHINNNIINSFSLNIYTTFINSGIYPIYGKIYLYKNIFYIIRQYLYFILMSDKWNIIINSKLVGISEAIRLVFIYLNIFIFNLYKNIYLLLINHILKNNYLYNINLSIISFSNKNINLFKILNKKEDENNKELREKIEKEIIIEKEKLINNSSLSLKGSEWESSSIKKSCNKNIIYKENDIKFNEWLAGIIDGDGYFNLSKKGTARLIITMDEIDKSLLYEIKNKFGGKIYKTSKANAFRYQLSHKKGLIKLINAINGEIRNTNRLLQMNKLCIKYNIELLYPNKLKYNNGWFSGMLDSDGSISLNEKSGQILISISQKNLYLLEYLREIYNGKIYPVSKDIDAFRYVIYRKNELYELIDNYFNKYPLRSKKINRLNLIKEFYLLRTYKSKSNNNVMKYIDWTNFKEKWDRYLDK